MKEFDKWWKEASKDDRRYGPEDDYVAKDGWKAALEWALASGSWESVAHNIREELKNRKT